METKQALGMIETKGLVGSVEAADAMVKAVKGRVFDLGDLTPFWENRLQRYELMGVVF